MSVTDYKEWSQGFKNRSRYYAAQVNPVFSSEMVHSFAVTSRSKTWEGNRHLPMGPAISPPSPSTTHFSDYPLRSPPAFYHILYLGQSWWHWKMFPWAAKHINGFLFHIPEKNCFRGNSYGRTKYDFSNDTMRFMTPGQELILKDLTVTSEVESIIDKMGISPSAYRDREGASYLS